ncbi:MAG TPA: cobyrinate a,c-diamide synthase [Longimicrobiales bacterium]|nr:cobyrinate a,c-diamide synthase [Longimicrobiales bacterium]
MSTPRVLLAGLGGGGGKTLLSVGLVVAWRRRGLSVAPFKKGPDFIDAAWLTKAAGVPCRSLDLYLMSRDVVVRSFTSECAASDVAVVEGNRGLFDGVDARGTYSTAELAKLLRAPVLLVLDCTKSSRTAAAAVLGCQRLDEDVNLCGVILNQVGGARHEGVLRQAVEETCGIPVVGAVPHLGRHPFPERHLGLVPPDEHARVDEAVEEAGSTVERYVDLAAVWQLAQTAPALPEAIAEPARKAPVGDGAADIRIGVFRDAAFQFYYPDNLEALRREGARLVEVSPLADSALPDLDALYAGGGFPETMALALARNAPFREAVRRSVEGGLPVYAECGGAVYLGEELHVDGGVYPMSGAMPAAYGFGARPQGHGYTTLEAVRPNPFYVVGEVLRGHEFHYTFLQAVTAGNTSFAFRVERGHGFDGRQDGLCWKNALAMYTHVHAAGVEGWAASVVAAARRHRRDTIGCHSTPRSGPEV